MTEVKTIKETLPVWMEKKVIKLQLEIRAKKHTYSELLTNYNRYNEKFNDAIYETVDITKALMFREAYAREAERVKG